MRQITRSILVLAALVGMTATASAADYAVDNGHSMVVFKVKHLGVGNFWGVFHQVEGTFSYDKAAPAKSAIDVTIKADSVFTADKKRDGHLKSPDFFNAKQFPNMTFKSKSVAASGKGLKVTGDLTIRGKTKSVTVDVAVIGEGKDPWGNTRAGFEGRLTIKRSEFGVSFMPGGLGEEVELIIALEGIQKK